MDIIPVIVTFGVFFLGIYVGAMMEERKTDKHIERVERECENRINDIREFALQKPRLEEKNEEFEAVSTEPDDETEEEEEEPIYRERWE